MVEFDFFRSALNLMYEGIYFVDTDLKIGFWNKGAELITGFKADEVLNSKCSDNILNHVTDQGIKLCLGGCPLSKTLVDCQERQAVVYLHHKNGQRIKVIVRTTPIYDQGKLVGAAEVFKEAIEQRLFVENYDFLKNKTVENLKVLALYDQLTGLPNRRYLETILATKLTEQRILSIPCGVILSDIDDFRLVNNNYGHNIGDKVLRMVATSLLSAMEIDDVVGRWGGEEFLAVISAADEKTLIQTMSRMMVMIENSILREDQLNLSVTMSLGGTIAKKNESAYDLIERADQLMYKSKAKGKKCWTLG